MNLLSRRTFLKNSFLSSVIFITYKGELRAAVTPLETISILHTDLFTGSLEAPSIDFINPTSYLHVVILNHSKIDDDTKSYIRMGIKWLNEESVTKYKKVYAKLPLQKRHDILNDISKTSWGESWLDTIMTYLLEAMLGDPIYGSNKNSSGWKWLKHETGLPRPTKAYL